MSPLFPADPGASRRRRLDRRFSGGGARVHLVVSYDVVADRRRARLAKRLAGYLQRVQFSVFEGEVPENEVQRLLDEARDALDLSEDSLRVYHLCRACEGRSEILGTAPAWPSPDEDEVL
jgi:CRISPR-associated protein Cas2